MVRVFIIAATAAVALGAKKVPATPTAVVASDRCPVECTSYDMDGKQIVAAGQPFGHFEVKHLTLHNAGAHGPSAASAACKTAIGGCTVSVAKPHTCRHNTATNTCSCRCLGDTEAAVVATKAPTTQVGEIAAHFAIDTQMTLAGVTVATFTEAAQLGVRVAVAKAAGVHRENVHITGIKDVLGRRLAEASVSFDVTIDVFSAAMLKTVEAEVKAVVQDSHTADVFTALVSRSMVDSAKAAGATDAVIDALEAATAIATATETKDVSVLATPAPTKATPLELLSANQKGTWSATGANTFRLGDAKHQNHAYRKTFIGSNSGGGLCAAPGSSHFEAAVTMLGSTNSHVAARGNYAAISMRANAAKGSLGYQCRISTNHGDNGISLTRDGKTLTHACPRIDQSNGVMNRYSTGYDAKVAGPYTYHELCQIQERSKAASLFSKDQQYTMRMDLVEDADLNTVKVSCSVDGVTKLFFTDPCPLEGGAFALDAKYQSSFRVTDYTKMACDDIPTPAALVPSLADGLTLAGMGRTGAYWASKDLAATNSVAHRYAGGCNNGAYPYGASNHPGAAGFNREGGGRSNSALNVAALSSGSCIKDGFIEADVSFRGDFLGIANGYRKVRAGDTHIDENQRTGVAGIAMRVDPTNNGEAKSNAYDSFGYMCQMKASNGQVSLYRGRNGAHHNYNGLGSAYLSGRYRCKECTCKTTPSDASCTQFGFASGGWNASAKHTLRLEVANDADGHPNVKCSLDGVTIISVADKRQGRHKWFPTSARSPGPSAGTNSCGDFGLVTSDSDVVEYIVKDYTGKK